MADFSLVLNMFKQTQKAKNTPKSANPGLSRGASGSLGSRFFQGRNPMAGEQKDQEMMNSPIFKAFVSKMHPNTPITDYLRRIS